MSFKDTTSDRNPGYKTLMNITSPKSDIHVIAYLSNGDAGSNGIEELVYASTDEDDVKNKLLELKAKAIYEEDMKDPSRFHIMTFNGKEFFIKRS